MELYGENMDGQYMGHISLIEYNKQEEVLKCGKMVKKYLIGARGKDKDKSGVISKLYELNDVVIIWIDVKNGTTVKMPSPHREHVADEYKYLYQIIMMLFWADVPVDIPVSVRKWMTKEFESNYNTFYEMVVRYAHMVYDALPESKQMQYNVTVGLVNKNNVGIDFWNRHFR